jgi:hypothetical protein
VTPDEWQLRDAWLAEMWPVCRERPRQERDVEAAMRRISTPVNKPADKPSVDCEKAS